MESLSQQINVVIPVLNDAARLERLLAQLAGFEVIVVDGGSQDSSAFVAQAAKAVCLEANGGRGAQLAKGAGYTQLEWILFLHADSQLVAGWQKAVTDFMTEGQHALGVFRFALDDSRRRAKWLAGLVGLRCRLLGLPYGDQGLLIHRTAYLKAGGFQPLPLMEDVAFIKKFRKKEIYFFDHPLLTRAEKFQQRGYVRQSLKNIFLVLLFFLGVRSTFLAKFY